MSSPATALNCEPSTCAEEPLPREAKLCLAGCALTSATNSLTVRAEVLEVLTATHSGDVTTSTTGVRSAIGSNGSFLNSDGVCTSSGTVSRIVLPSGADLATTSVAIVALPPGRFSTMTAWPSSMESFSASRRPSTSPPPPGAKGTTIRATGFDWAHTGLPSQARHAARAANARNDRRVFVDIRFVSCRRLS